MMQVTDKMDYLEKILNVEVLEAKAMRIANVCLRWEYLFWEPWIKNCPSFA